MPLRTLKHIIMEAETRTLEFYLAGLSLTWGSWLLLAEPPVATNQFWSAMLEAGGVSLWSWSALITAGFQLLSVWYQYPRLRRWSSGLAVIYWTVITYTTLRVDARMFSPWFAAMMTLGELWVVTHRASVGK